MTDRRIKVAFTGGGSAGHVLPALPVMRALKQRGTKVVYIGSMAGAEKKYLAGEGIAYHGVASGKLRRYFSWRNVADMVSVARGIWQSYWLLGSLAPNLIFSKGGFISLPVVWAGWLRRVPIVAHESDFSPGLANRLAMPFLSALCTSFPSTRPKWLRGALIHSGSPVRPELLEGCAEQGRALVSAPPGVPLVLVTGGSLGAEALNALVRSAAPSLVNDCCLVHVCGPGKAAHLDLPGYHQFEFVAEGWGDLLAAADAVVSRAGANALFELLTLGKPHILVPLPRSSSRGDQVENAAYAEQAGYSMVIAQESLDEDRLVQAIRELLRDRAKWAARLSRFEAPPAVEHLVCAVERFCRPG